MGSSLATNRLSPSPLYLFSERLALVAGIVLPAGETWRRWGSLWDYPWAYLDDLSLGTFLLIAVWMSRRHSGIGDRCLSAAWGYTCAIGCGSLASTVNTIEQTDPAGVPGAVAAGVKAAMLAVGVIGLVGAIRGRDV